jgi:hypothetical protein
MRKLKATRISGDCPICYRYSSQTTCFWRDKAFCCNEHRRKYMHETLVDESMEEYEELWQKLKDK